MADHLRRGLLFGKWRSKDATPFRPPWSLNETAFTDGCTRCQACVDACPTGVVIAGGGNYPMVDFSRGECTFCYDCASACPQPLFAPQETTPWQLIAAINDSCLAHQQVMCRSCQDSCEVNAIQFRLQAGQVARPELNSQCCTGCGACVSACPVSALSIRSRHEPTVASL